MQDYWQMLVAYPMLGAILLVALGYGIGRILKSIIHRLMDRFAETSESKLDYKIAHLSVFTRSADNGYLIHRAGACDAGLSRGDRTSFN